MVGTDQGLRFKRTIPPEKSQCSCRCIKKKGILSLHDDSKPKTGVSTRNPPTEFANYTARHPKYATRMDNFGRSDKASSRLG